MVQLGLSELGAVTWVTIDTKHPLDADLESSVCHVLKPKLSDFNIL